MWNVCFTIVLLLPFSQQNAFLKVAADSHHLIIPGDPFSVLYCSLTDRYHPVLALLYHHLSYLPPPQCQSP